MVQHGKGPIYIFDSSAWIECNDRAGDNRIPALLDTLHQERRLCSPKEVFGELERPGVISDWAKERRVALNHPRGTPVEYARNQGLVQYRFPSMGRALGSKERADPYVVALSMTYHCEEQAYIIVTGESRNRRPRRKISGACDEFGLPCITLEELIERELRNDGEAPGEEAAE